MVIGDRGGEVGSRKPREAVKLALPFSGKLYK